MNATENKNNEKNVQRSRLLSNVGELGLKRIENVAAGGSQQPRRLTGGEDGSTPSTPTWKPPARSGASMHSNNRKFFIPEKPAAKRGRDEEITETQTRA